MSLKIDENYRIEKDVSSWNLMFERIGEVNPKTGKRTVSRNVTYHANIKQALIKYCDEQFESCKTIADVIQKINELTAKIEAMDFGGVK